MIRTQENAMQVQAALRLFGGWRRRTDATELFDDDEHHHHLHGSSGGDGTGGNFYMDQSSYFEDNSSSNNSHSRASAAAAAAAGGGGGGGPASSSSSLKRLRRLRWAGRSHSTGRTTSILPDSSTLLLSGASSSFHHQRFNSAERPRAMSAERAGHENGGGLNGMLLLRGTKHGSYAAGGSAAGAGMSGMEPATPSVLATPAAALATPAVLMAPYDSAKGRLPPSAGGRYKTPYQEQQQQHHAMMLAAAAASGGAGRSSLGSSQRGYTARQTPVNLAALQEQMQHPIAPAPTKTATTSTSTNTNKSRKILPSNGSKMRMSTTRTSTPSASASPIAPKQQQQQQKKQSPIPLSKSQPKRPSFSSSSSSKHVVPIAAATAARRAATIRQASQKGMMRRSSNRERSASDLHQKHMTRRLASFLDPQQQADMQAQHTADQRLSKNLSPTAIYQQPHVPAMATATTRIPSASDATTAASAPNITSTSTAITALQQILIDNAAFRKGGGSGGTFSPSTRPLKAIGNGAVVGDGGSTTTTLAVRPVTTKKKKKQQQQQHRPQRSSMVQARLDRRLQSAHRFAGGQSSGYELPNSATGTFSSSIVTPIAEHPTPNSMFDDGGSTSWEEDSVMSAGRLVHPSSSSTAMTARGRRAAAVMKEESYPSDQQKSLLDSSNSGDDSISNQNKDPNYFDSAMESPSISEDDHQELGEGDDQNDDSHNSDQFLMMDMDVVDALPRSFPRARKVQQQYHHARRVQLPEYYRSYNFSEDPDAIQPKIRKREDRDAMSLANASAFSSTSRTSVCSVSTRSAGAFSIRSAGAASCVTSSTQGSTRSTASAPPNLWEVDRQLHKKTRNVETHTDLYKLVQSPTADDNLVKETIVLTTRGGGSGTDIGTSPWKGEAMGVPHKVSISFRRLTLRTQVRELKELLDDDHPSRMMASSIVPPTPPFHDREGVVLPDQGRHLQQSNIIVESLGSNGKKKKAHNRARV